MPPSSGGLPCTILFSRRRRRRMPALILMLILMLITLPHHLRQLVTALSQNLVSFRPIPTRFLPSPRGPTQLASISSINLSHFRSIITITRCRNTMHMLLPLPFLLPVIITIAITPLILRRRRRRRRQPRQFHHRPRRHSMPP